VYDPTTPRASRGVQFLSYSQHSYHAHFPPILLKEKRDRYVAVPLLSYCASTRVIGSVPVRYRESRAL
jgi:hypothetical protein